MMIMREVGLDIGPVIMGAGILGLALSFGAQNLMRDMITGFFILLENHFRVGDVINTAGVAGLVESISLRVTTLRDLEGKVHIIPNGEMAVVSNLTKEWSRCVVDIGVAYKENVDNVMELLRDIGKQMADDTEFGSMILEPLEILGLDQFADSAVVIKTMTKTIPLKQWAVAREFRRRVKNTFDEKGIEIPFPHQTIYMGEAENTGKLVVETKAAGGA
jgi:small conductance mechanosensitive channel